MSDMKKGYCACCGGRVDYFKYAGNVKCLKCGATTIPTEKSKGT
jgi:hypothetical protein